MEQAKREVNSETEVVDADDIKDTPEEEKEDLDEEVIPPVKEGEEPKESEQKEESEEKPKEEPKEQPKEEETPESSPEDEEEAPPKPVEGETPREKALRLEVQRVKKINRDRDKADLLKGTKDQSPKPSDDYEKLKEQYTSEELANMEDLVEVIAKQKGFVRKDETYEGAANAVLDTFLEDHEEYDPKSDVDDLRWGTFTRILSEDYNLRNKTPKQIRSIFQKVDRDVKDELGETAPEIPEEDKKEKERVAAQRQKIQSVSHSGGTKSEKIPKKKVDPSNVGGIAFTGFDPEDFVEDES